MGCASAWKSNATNRHVRQGHGKAMTEPHRKGKAPTCIAQGARAVRTADAQCKRQSIGLIRTVPRWRRAAREGDGIAAARTARTPTARLCNASNRARQDRAAHVTAAAWHVKARFRTDTYRAGTAKRRNASAMRRSARPSKGYAGQRTTRQRQGTEQCGKARRRISHGLMGNGRGYDLIGNAVALIRKGLRRLSRTLT